jgi:hypothetical protein
MATLAKYITRRIPTMPATATRATIGGVPTKPIEAQGVTAAPRGETISRFTKMALESTDFIAKLRPVQPVVFFASSTDDRGNIVLDTFIDFGYFHVNGIRVRQRRGTVRASDGTTVDNFSVSLRGVPVNPQYGGEIYLNMLRQERTLPNGNVLQCGNLIVGGLNVHQIGEFVWIAYCAGKYSGIDHDKAGVRRLTKEQLAAKIDAAIAARESRTHQLPSTPQNTDSSISF